MDNKNSPYLPPQAPISDPVQTVKPVPKVDLPKSPLSFKGLYLLCVKPGQFFSDHGWLLKSPELILVIWISGISYTIERIDQRLLRENFKVGTAGQENFTSLLTNSWVTYWMVVLAAGAISAWIIFYLAGWWYRMRLNWSGAEDVDAVDARSVFVYQDLVYSAPLIILTLVSTVFYQNYAQYWVSDEMWSSLVVLFLFWSCYVSYQAALTFPVVKWKARIWFLILPNVLYLVAFVGLASLAYFFSDS